MTTTTFKLYQPAIARASFYCSACDNQVSVGESCTDVVHPVENEDDFPVVTTICEDCLYEEAN